MKFLVDECTGPSVAAWLRDEGHEVFSVYEDVRGVEDDIILQKAFDENWVLITNDKDFGDKVFRNGRLHKGVVLLRLED
jgi:predicted nuclease of predicted toxin-antitoxin system